MALPLEGRQREGWRRGRGVEDEQSRNGRKEKEKLESLGQKNKKLFFIFSLIPVALVGFGGETFSLLLTSVCLGCSSALVQNPV